MSVRNVISHLYGNKRGLWQSFKRSMRTIRYPFGVPKPMYPRIAPYVLNREKTSLQEAVGIYRRVGGLPTLIDSKSSDTLSILGSGASINDLTNKDFDFIDSTNSMALNWWGVYHDYVPDFYKFEFLAKPELDTKWIKQMNEQSKRYEDTTLIFDPEPPLNKGECFSDYFRQLNLSSWREFIDIRVTQYFVESGETFETDLISHLFPTWPGGRLFHYRGSLSQALAMGVIMGYDDIILFGVDLNDSEYFWGDHPVWELKGKPDTEEKHATAADEGFRGIDDYIRVLDTEILPERGTQLHIGSKESELYPDLSYFREAFDRAEL